MSHRHFRRDFKSSMIKMKVKHKETKGLKRIMLTKMQLNEMIIAVALNKN